MASCLGGRDRRKEEPEDVLSAVAFLPSARGPEQAAEAATDRLFSELRVWLEDTLRPLASELEALRSRQRRCERALGLEDIVPPRRDEDTAELPAKGLLQQVEELLAKEHTELSAFVTSEVAKASDTQRSSLEKLREQQVQLQTSLAATAKDREDAAQKLRQDIDECQNRLNEVGGMGGTASTTKRSMLGFGRPRTNTPDRGGPAAGDGSAASVKKKSWWR